MSFLQLSLSSQRLPGLLPGRKLVLLMAHTESDLQMFNRKRDHLSREQQAQLFTEVADGLHLLSHPDSQLAKRFPSRIMYSSKLHNFVFVISVISTTVIFNYRLFTLIKSQSLETLLNLRYRNNFISFFMSLSPVSKIQQKKPVSCSSNTSLMSSQSSASPSLGEHFFHTNRERKEVREDSGQAQDETQHHNIEHISKIIDICMCRQGSWMLLVKWDWLGMKESLSDLLELDNVD